MGLENYSRDIRAAAEEAGIGAGDEVEVKLRDSIYRGILLPRPLIGGDPGSLVIKLENGYNVGLKWTESTSMARISGGRSLEAFPGLSVEPGADLPEISVVSTGGTISSRLDYDTGGVKWLMEPGQMFFLVPELAERVSIRNIRRPFAVGSENMSARHWIQLAEDVAGELESGVKGVLVTHGTDTMHYSTAALSFMLRGLPAPVVFTGAQRSTDRGSTDASMNLLCAASVAAESGLPEVCLVMHGETNDSYCLIHRGTRVRKMHTSRRDAFRSINELPLGRAWPDGRIELREKASKVDEGPEVDTVFEERIALIKFYPGMEPEMIDFLVDRGYRGILLEATALGHLATDESDRDLIPSISRAIEEGLVVAAASQTLYGRTDPLVYSEGRKIWNLGVVYCGDMLPETAYVKLGWVLGHDPDPAEAKRMMEHDYAGEISEVSDPRSFLS